MELVSSCKTYNIDTLNALTKEGFQIIHLNIRSIRKNYLELCGFLSSVNYRFDLICLSETFLYEYEHTYFPLPNYVFVGHSRPTRNGGAGMYVRSSIAIEAEPVHLNGAEAVKVTLAGVGDRPLSITSIYRTPASDVGGFVDSLNLYFYKMRHNNHIITGDINIDSSNANYHSYIDSYSAFNYQNLITIPTRVTSISSTCIDHILVNFDEYEYDSGTVELGITDHYPVFVILKKECIQASKPQRQRKINKESISKLHCEFPKVDWGGIFEETCVDNAYCKFLEKTKAVFDLVAPYANIECRRKSRSNLWFTEDLKKQIRKKNQLFSKHIKFPFSPKLKIAYQTQRNYVSCVLKETKSNYYEKLLKNERDPRKIWNTINSGCGRNTSYGRFTPTKLKIDDSEIIEDEEKIAAQFNSYFTSIGSKLAEKFESQEECFDTLCNTQAFSLLDPFQLSPVESNLVLNELKALNEKKAMGLDEIPAKLVVASASYIAQPFTYIINLSIQNGIVPKLMKNAKVTPVYKNKGSRLDSSNYRPISILSIFSKVLEKIVNTQIHLYLSEKNIINHDQFGFLKNKGTGDALIEFSKRSFRALGKGHTILGVFLDFSKAFDTVNHRILIYKLKSLYKFHRNTISWFENYLTNRTQSVHLNCSLSNSLPITCGVPQGSILGPTLFLLYINDLSSSVPLFQTILFADDTNLFLENNNINDKLGEINDELLTVSRWCNKNKLTVNLTKTNYLHIKNYQNPITINGPIQINNTNLLEVTSTKFLGIQIDQNLSWSDHINTLKSDLHKSLGLIYRASSFLPEKILILLYNSLINSKIVYCLESWGNAADTHLNKILVIQKKIVRIIYKKPPTEHTVPLFQKACILPIKQLYTLRICLLAHSAFYKSSINLSEPHYHTRSTALSLPVEFSTTTCGQRELTYRYSDAWNHLPTNLRVIDNKIAFKIALKRHLLESLD